MAIAEPQTTTPLRVTRRLAAPREKVFRAWTSSQGLSRWFAPTDDYQTEVLELDLRPGGRYRFRMTHRDGGVHTVRGTYQEVHAPERLAFTWQWEEKQHDIGDTLVTIDLAEAPDGTDLTLVHTGLPSASARQDHAKGWDACLARLEEKLPGI